MVEILDVADNDPKKTFTKVYYITFCEKKKNPYLIPHYIFLCGKT